MTREVCCCNGDQLTTVITAVICLVACALLWKTPVLAPLKVVVVFLHESSHALAGCVTGGKVNDNYGGVTYTQGGNRCFTLSAGYTGSVLFGALFLLLSYSKIARYAGATMFIIACLLTPLVMRKGSNGKWRRVIVLAIFTWVLGAIVVGFWVWDWYKEPRISPLRVCLLIIGTFCTCHAVYDVISGTLLHKINNKQEGKSDAVMMAEEIGGSARCWGLVWTLISLSVLASVVFALIVIDDHECWNS